jgi:hypothetical protein
MKAKDRFLILVAAAMAGVALIGSACQKGLNTSAPAVARGPGETADVVAETVVERTGGALLWSQTCMRCHNLRNPRERSDRQWDVIVHHMRVRANLTAEEHRAILGFLQAAN